MGSVINGIWDTKTVDFPSTGIIRKKRPLLNFIHPGYFLNLDIMEKLNQLITQLENSIPFSSQANPAISAGNVGWHIDHSILVINQILGALEASDPKDYEWKFNVKRTVVFFMNKIPRGKAKAPKSVLPAEHFQEETVRANMTIARYKIEQLSHLPPDAFFVHPYFGKLNVKATRKMLLLHTAHHLQIIKDVTGS